MSTWIWWIWNKHLLTKQQSTTRTEKYEAYESWEQGKSWGGNKEFPLSGAPQHFQQLRSRKGECAWGKVCPWILFKPPHIPSPILCPYPSNHRIIVPMILTRERDRLQVMNSHHSNVPYAASNWCHVSLCPPLSWAQDPWCEMDDWWVRSDVSYSSLTNSNAWLGISIQE